ncbi:MAG: hypothetical protein HXS54_06000 [Theionarchaea archaeon]|nr:hypothetical protein [Theionarchaea archaeon]DBA34812.1 TPA_asm: hypothetical protein vir521_00018 [Caudoviricetes sp. vir521]
MCIDRTLKMKKDLVEEYKLFGAPTRYSYYPVGWSCDITLPLYYQKGEWHEPEPVVFPETVSGYAVCNISILDETDCYIEFELRPLYYNRSREIRLYQWEGAQGNVGNGFHIWRTIHGARSYLNAEMEKALSPGYLKTLPEGYAIVQVICKGIETSGDNVIISSGELHRQKRLYNAFTCRNRKVSKIVDMYLKGEKNGNPYYYRRGE